ncbi:uncharacterized protein LOC128882924 isoform X2 [Hylaeus volcanicus]|uniref:uncharacterized protein LOC128882924 isoform X2 n=1 Tax=Hylaeus volcanicus TaxID=313075 RepID=UPI0023B779C7|nr:uncharacterized protein LOC128882924 isoform X2 [Hylaeus volcanicus]
MDSNQNYGIDQKIDLDTKIQVLREHLLKTTIENSPTIVKNIYDEHPAVALMKKKQVSLFRKKYNLVIDCANGEKNKNPVLTFEQAAFPEDITKELEECYNLPTPIQSQTWPFLMTGRNLIVQSPPGTGKTLAYVLPCILHVISQDRLYCINSPIGLIVTPTRELAIQVGSIVIHYALKFNLRSYILYGGNNIERRQQYPKKGIVHIVVSSFLKISTICTFTKNKKRTDFHDFRMNRVSFLVFDGIPNDSVKSKLLYIEEYKCISISVHPKCQISVWISDNKMLQIKEIIMEILQKSFSAKNFCSVSMMCGNYISKNISQSVYVLHTVKEKREKTASLLQYWRNYQSIISVKIDEIDALYDFLNARNKNMSFQKVHSKLEQCERNLAIQSFKSKLVSCLLTTKGILKGIDLPNATHIVNYNCPTNHHEYKCLIGSIGRADRKGVAVTLILKDDVKTCSLFLKNILNFLKDEYVQPKLRDLVLLSYKIEMSKTRKLRAKQFSSHTLTSNQSQLDQRAKVNKPQEEKLQEEVSYQDSENQRY